MLKFSLKVPGPLLVMLLQCSQKKPSRNYLHPFPLGHYPSSYQEQERLLENNLKFSAFRLSSPHLEPHGMGRLHSTRPRQDCLSSFVHRQGLARPPASPAALALALHESARKSILFSRAAGQSITDVCTTFMFSGFFSYEEGESEYTFFLTR